MNTNEIISIIGLCFSGILFVTSLIMFFKNTAKDKVGEGEKTAKIESKIDYIKIQTELITAQSKQISAKIDSQNDRLIVVEQTVKDANISQIPTTLARLDESIKSAHKRIDELETRIQRG